MGLDLIGTFRSTKTGKTVGVEITRLHWSILTTKVTARPRYVPLLGAAGASAWSMPF